MSDKTEKKYLIDNPALMSEWDWERNNELGLKPEKLLIHSNKPANWKCAKDHEWRATISDRSRGFGCPYCAGQKVLKGYNDLSTVNPILAREWNFERNDSLTPSQVTFGSGKKVWWKCKKGHEWQAPINIRHRGVGCPYCSGRCAIVGKTDLLTLNPDLAKEWNFDKNVDLKPEQFTVSSGKKVWWKCSKGHEWEATIHNRNKGRGCPICKSERNTSFPEYALMYYFEKYGLDVLHSYKGNGYELDVYIPSKKVAIEYDGYYWHRNRTKKDLEKNSSCQKDGITLYRIREGLPSLDDISMDFVVQNNQKELQIVLEKILGLIIESKVEIDLKRDALDIENLRGHTEKETSILFAYPELAREWNYEKNGELKPEHCLVHSGKRVWWKCSKGHEWRAVIQHRVKGIGCPYCSGRYAIKGETDLQTVNPKLASEWNYEKNNGLTPADILPNCSKKVWWTCGKGHEWMATANSRTRGAGCPRCSGRCVIKGENDLQTVNPDLASEWNYEKNNGLTPADVLPKSNKNVWWKCKQGHVWKAIIGNRTKGHGCPYCAGQKTVKGQNDLQTIHPELVKEWDYEKNNGLTPADVMPYSDKKVWWKCSKGHEWLAVVKSRIKGHGCPYCSGRMAIKGKTDLQTINSRLAREWNYEKNNGLTPADVLPYSNKKVWWKCRNNHEWQATINNRNQGRGCPYCSGRKKPT